MRWTSTDHDSKVTPIREAVQSALSYGDARLGNTGMVEKALYGCIIDKSHLNNDSFIVEALECGQICAAINNQPPLIRAWLHWAYGPRDNKHDQCEAAMGVMWANFPKIGANLWDKHVKLCEIATLDYKCQVIAGKRLPREVYYSTLGTIQNNWIRDWGRKLNLCLDTLADYDNGGLQGISGVIRSICAR